MIERFPDVPVVVWPIQEFTYLEPSRWNGTLSAVRRPHIDAYWKAADPEFCDGPGAESFATLLRRAEDALARLRELPDDSQVLVFSHGQFIHAVRMVVFHPGATDKQRMLHFWRADGMPAVQNAELIEFARTETSWQLGGPGYCEESCPVTDILGPPVSVGAEASLVSPVGPRASVFRLAQERSDNSKHSRSK